MSGPRYAFEDFHVGLVIDGGERIVTADEIVAFATRFDPQPFHVDAEAASASVFGGLIASGWHTVAMTMRIACERYLNDSTSAGSPGVDEIRWLKPVRPGDTLKPRFEVVEARPSTRKPDRGTVTVAWQVSNQHGDVVMTTRGMGIFLRRKGPTS